MTNKHQWTKGVKRTESYGWMLTNVERKLMDLGWKLMNVKWTKANECWMEVDGHRMEIDEC